MMFARRMALGAAGLALAAGLASPPALAQISELPPRPSVITNPDWARLPTAEDIGRFYPGQALRLDKSGRAVLRCRVTATGTLDECIVADETPPGLGFGAAALAMSPYFLMKPQTKDGFPVSGAMVSIPVVFALAEPPEKKGFFGRLFGG